MNMEQNPTLEQLKELLRSGDDHAGSHILWVRRGGAVILTCLRGKKAVSNFVANLPADMQMRYETFPAGYEYVGEDTFGRDEWLPVLFGSMVREWEATKGE